MSRPSLRMIPFVMMISLLAVLSSPARADDGTAPPQVSSTIESVSLFKHGLAVVRRTLVLPRPGVFDIADLPEPIHGTFWVESSATCSIRMTETDVARESDPPLPTMNGASLGGCTVFVRFKQDHLPAVRGVVQKPVDATQQWNQDYGWARPSHSWWWSGYGAHNRNSQPAPAQGFVVESDRGSILIDTAQIAYIEVLERPAQTTVRRPVMRITVSDDAAPRGTRQSTQGQPIEVEIVYLAKGASWAPSYAVDITDPDDMQFRQKAVIRNELEDWHEAEIFLITGYPSIEFGHVLSPMSPATDLATFFRALGEQRRLTHSSRGDVMSQTVMSNYASSQAASAVDAADPALTGIDLQYHSIGRWSLGRGESMVVPTASETTGYERIVQWVVPDMRDEDGRAHNRSQYSISAMSLNRDVAWDAVRFANPMDRPMTTAPIAVMEDGLIKGQQSVTWTAPGQSVTAPINHALSVWTDFSEYEVENSRREVARWGSAYIQTDVNSMLRLHNQRAEPITMVIHREFSGELVEADDNPDSVLLRSGATRLNPQRRLIWTIELQPGEQREINFTYRLIRRR